LYFEKIAPAFIQSNLFVQSTIIFLLFFACFYQLSGQKVNDKVQFKGTDGKTYTGIITSIANNQYYVKRFKRLCRKIHRDVQDHIEARTMCSDLPQEGTPHQVMSSYVSGKN
jgi:hypothetical protein